MLKFTLKLLNTLTLNRSFACIDVDIIARNNNGIISLNHFRNISICTNTSLFFKKFFSQIQYNSWLREVVCYNAYATY